MLILANLLNAIAALLGGIINFVVILVIARVVVSWVNADPNNTLVRIILSSTEPLLQPLARRLPLRASGIDFTPIVLILLLSFLNMFLVQTIRDYALVMRQRAIMESQFDSGQLHEEFKKLMVVSELEK